MHHRCERIRALFFVGLTVIVLTLVFVASEGVTWAAPTSQGTVPTPRPRATPTSAPAPTSNSVEPNLPPPPPNNVEPLPPAPTPSATRGPAPYTGTCCLPGIVFTARRDGNEGIYIMKNDGTGLARLSNPGVIDRNPAGSPDGLRVAFESNRDDPDPANCGKPGRPNCITHIYTMKVDGTDVRQLTTGPGQDIQPIWSMGSTRIAFVSNLADPNLRTCGQQGQPACVNNIYIMNSDGTGIVRLTGTVPGNPNASNWDPNWSPDDLRIAFASDRDGNAEIYVINTDATGLVRLTNNAAADGHPAWSPDAKQLAFETNRDGDYQLYVMNNDGSNVQRLTNDTANDRRPVWLPGCSDRIVFASDREGGVLRIYTIDPDGQNPTRLTGGTVDSSGWDDSPSWSGLPANQRPAGPCCVAGVTFDSLRDGNEEIYLMRSDGSRLTRLTTNSARDTRPAPSPDGKRIVFQSNRDGKFQLYVMNVDGSGTVRLTNSFGEDTSPAWSNDGNEIAFVSTRDDIDPATCGLSGRPACVTHIYVMNADGSGVTRVTTGTGQDDNPAWSPDSKVLVFQSNRDGNNEIYMASVDGNGLVRLTNDPADDAHPSFSTDSSEIAFESNRDGKYQVYVMNVDGSGVKKLTELGENRRPYWCPACADRILFSSNRDAGVFSIYAMSSNGRDQVRLTTQAAGVKAGDDNPEWSGLPSYLPSPVAKAIPPLLPPSGAPQGTTDLDDWWGRLGRGVALPFQGG